MKLPISVCVPLSKKRAEFFHDYTLPSIYANNPAEVLIDDRKAPAQVKRNRLFSKTTQPYVFLYEHNKYTSAERPVLVSCRSGKAHGHWLDGTANVMRLCCVSEYPTPLENVCLSRMWGGVYRGLSDHTTHWLTGALAVATGAKIVEKHVCLSDCSASDPDYGHSLVMGGNSGNGFHKYVWAIREAEKAMGA